MLRAALTSGMFIIFANFPPPALSCCHLLFFYPPLTFNALDLPPAELRRSSCELKIADRLRRQEIKLADNKGVMQ